LGIRGRETVKIVSTVNGALDAYNNPIQVETTTPVEGCLIAWGGTGRSDTLWATSVDTEATIFFPRGTQVKLTDNFILPDGSRYEWAGSPTNWVPQKGSPVKTKVIVEVKRVL